MKRNLFFVVGLALILLIPSCINDNELDSSSEGEKSVVSIKFSNKSTDSRMYAPTDPSSDDSNDGDVKVSTYTYYIINEAGAVITSGTKTFNESLEDEIETKSTAVKIYIVGNTSSVFTATTEAGLQSEMVDALYNATAGSVATQNTTLVEGHGDISFTGTGGPGVVPTASVDIQLNPIPVRFKVTVINAMTNYSADHALLLDSVGVLSSAIKTYLIPSGAGDLPYTVEDDDPVFEDDPYYVGGIKPADWTERGNSATIEQLALAWDGGSNDVGDDSRTISNKYFYAYPGDSETTIVAVHGRLSTKAGEQRGDSINVWYPVQFTGKDKATEDVSSGAGSYDIPTLKAGKQYNVTIKLSGDANNDGGGNYDPKEEAADIDITVQEAVWDVVIDITKEFN